MIDVLCAGDASSGMCWGDVNSQGVLVDMFRLAAANILSVVFRVRGSVCSLSNVTPRRACSACLYAPSSRRARAATPVSGTDVYCCTI